MEILYKISELLKKQGKTQKQLCNYLKLSRQTFSEWNAGRSKSYMKYLPEISNFLNVSIDFLLGRDENKFQHNNYQLSPEEAALILAYRKQPEKIKNAAKRLLAVEETHTDNI
ncbi:MAG: helix-turn-helix domain-containing protein [Clostridiales bacterium]|nr:helix-turn-helix domain-containing protein [Clostridiales bacterium]